MCLETDLGAGSAKGSYGTVSKPSRRKCLVGSVDFKLLALTLRRDIRVEKKGSQGLAHLSKPEWKVLCGPQQNWCRLLPCPYCRSGVKPCINFSHSCLGFAAKSNFS